MKCANCGEGIRKHSTAYKHFDGEIECNVVNWYTGARLIAELRTK